MAKQDLKQMLDEALLTLKEETKHRIAIMCGSDEGEAFLCLLMWVTPEVMTSEKADSIGNKIGLSPEMDAEQLDRLAEVIHAQAKKMRARHTN